MEIVISIIVLTFILGIFIIFKFSRTKKLSQSQKIKMLKNYKIVQSNNDKKHQIIDFDKLYHKILLELGYKGSFGEILKQQPRVIQDVNKVWELHKLRNKLVHDFEEVSQEILNKKSKEYEKIVKDLLSEV